MLTHQNERIFEYSNIRSFRKRFVRYISNIRFSPNKNGPAGPNSIRTEYFLTGLLRFI